MKRTPRKNDDIGFVLMLILAAWLLSVTADASEFCVTLEAGEACAAYQEIELVDVETAPYPGIEPAAHRNAGWFVLGATAADVATTAWALNACSVCYEGNALSGGPGVDVVTNPFFRAGVSLGALWVTKKLRERGRDKLAFWSRLFVGGVYSAAAVNNIAVAQASR